MVVTIPSNASSTAFPSSREKTRGNLCVAGRRGRVIALSVCLRDSACSASRSCPLARGPCTFGTHLRVLQSFLRLRFAGPRSCCDIAAGPPCRQRECVAHPEDITEILTRPLYTLTRRRSTTILVNVTRRARKACERHPAAAAAGSARPSPPACVSPAERGAPSRRREASLWVIIAITQ